MALSDEEIKNIYVQLIKPDLDRIKVSENPTCIFLGGQPGSGKSHLGDISVNTLENKSAFKIDVDSLRENHPDKKNVDKDNLYSLDVDTRKWADMLVADAIKEKKNVIIDGTFGGDVIFSHNRMKEFKGAGHVVKLNVLATNDVVSKIGFNYRYEKQKAEIGNGRPVDLTYHNQIYKSIPGNLKSTFEKGLVDEFNIYKRDHTIPDYPLKNSYTASELKSDINKPVIDYVKERIRPFTEPEIKRLKSWCYSTAKLTESNKGDINAFKASLTTDDKCATADLKKQITAIIGVAELKIEQNNSSKISF